MYKKVFITGAGTGIGKDAAIALAKRGHVVFAATHYKEEADIINEYAKSHGLTNNLKGIKLNLLEKEDIIKILDYDIDVLINNAAIGDTGSVMDIDVDRYRNTFETNLFSPIELTQLALKNMILKKSGRIIFISSLFGRISMEFFSPYSSTRFAIEAVAESFYREAKLLENEGINIDVVLIEPGTYKTGFNQCMMNKKYDWMKKRSYFNNMVEEIKEKEQNFFEKAELKSTDSIVEEYIKATEDNKVKRRYTAPKRQSFMTQVIRIFGK